MSKGAAAQLSGVTDATLRHSIENRRGDVSIVALERSASAYATSCPLEDITAHLSDGTTLHLMLKHLSPSARHERAKRAKPAFLLDAERESIVYRDILSPRGLGATLVGLAPEGAAWPWLLIEKAAGAELYQIGDLRAWSAAAQWIAALHRAFPADEARRLRGAHRLLTYDRPFCLRWMQRSLAFFATEAPVSRHDRAALVWLSDRFERVIDRLLASPMALIHGECYASNVLAAQVNGRWRVCPVDWEMAAIGPAVIDLAALTSGEWAEDARDNILAGYREGSASHTVTLDALSELVDYAQLYLAVQWLGWFGRRRAATEHARDWLADAIERAERLNL